MQSIKQLPRCVRGCLFGIALTLLSHGSVRGQILVPDGTLVGSSSCYSQNSLDGPHESETWPTYEPSTEGDLSDFTDSLSSPTSATRRSSNTSDSSTTAGYALDSSSDSLTLDAAFTSDLTLDSTIAPRTAPKATFTEDFSFGFDLTSKATFTLSGSNNFLSDGGVSGLAAKSGVVLYNTKTDAIVKSFKLKQTDGVFSFSGTLKPGDYALTIQDGGSLTQSLGGTFPQDDSSSSGLDVQFSLEALQAVPEPSTWAMVLTGFTFIVFWRTRAGRRSAQRD